ncbi:hypothetical protein IMY97_22675 [Pectobacterium versatile]|uniref:hypothetical protein n=1 Tax=Pectobacterium versatile TaxID=2488639 RepID=UPI001FA7F65A|nr:hypothetical protein [Pectobacterium versatile]UNE80061.1 hypothetical protein IMY97_22675 [Pectobacterium versatile]
MAEFSPDIVITKSKKPDKIEKTLATKFNASLLFVNVCVRKIENAAEAKMFNIDTDNPVMFMFFNMLASYIFHYNSFAAKSSRISFAYFAFIDFEP